MTSTMATAVIDPFRLIITQSSTSDAMNQNRYGGSRPREPHPSSHVQDETRSKSQHRRLH